MNKKIFQQISEEFIAEVQRKNSWGKNEITSLWANTVNRIVLAQLPED